MTNESDYDEPKIAEDPVIARARSVFASIWEAGRDTPLGARNPWLKKDRTAMLESLRGMCEGIWNDGHAALPEDPNPYAG